MRAATIVKVAIFAAAISVASGVLAAGKQCTDFEKEVYETANKVRLYQQSQKFMDFGWSVGGPFNQDLKRIQALQDDNENVIKLMGEYGFTPMDIYNVANEYRTEGWLDAFYAEIERSINELTCR